MAAWSVPMPSGVLALIPTRDGSTPSRSGDLLLNLRRVRADLWFSQDQRAVDIADLVAGFVDQSQRFFHEEHRIGALPLGIARRKVGSDVTGGDGTEQSVGQGMQQDIAIGVAGEAAGVRQRDAPDLQRDAGPELVRVPAEADARDAGNLVSDTMLANPVASELGTCLLRVEHPVQRRSC